MVKSEISNSKNFPALPWLKRKRRCFHQSLGVGAWATKNRAAWEKLGPWRRHNCCWKYCPKQGKKERHTLASPHLPYSILLLMTFIGQTNQKPIGKEAWAMYFAEIKPLRYRTEQEKQRKGI